MAEAHFSSTSMPITFHLLFATQSSQAQRLADDVFLQLSKYDFQVSIDPIDKVTPQICLKQTRHNDRCVLLFFVSTASQGEVPLMARDFFANLPRILKHKDPASLRQYSVFGLGDSKYPFYNYGAKKFVKRLSYLGLKDFVPSALGDDSHAFGPIGELDAWTREILKAAHAPLSGRIPNLKPDPGALLNFQLTDWAFVTNAFREERPRPYQETLGWDEARVITNCRMTSEDHFQDVRYLLLELPAPPHLGDLISIWPRRAECKLTAFFDSIGISNPAETLVSGINWSPRIERFNGRSLQEIFTVILDVNSIPSRAFLERFANLFPIGVHKKRLLEMTSHTANGLRAYMDYVIHEKRSIAEIVIDFSLGFPDRSDTSPDSEFKSQDVIDFLISYTPDMAPRSYSIASAPHWHDYLQAVERIRKRFSVNVGLAKRLGRALISSEIQNRRDPHFKYAELCVAVKKNKTFLQRKIEGLCSSYLADIRAGDSLWLQVKPGPVDMTWICDQQSQLLLACGTGVAPVRSLMQHFYLSHASAKEQNVLLGFRHPDKDFLFKKDLINELACANIKLHITWSRLNRGQDDDTSKRYIQNDLEDFTPYRELLLSKETSILIAGKSHPMPKEVLETIDRVTGDPAIISHKLREGRLVIDTWG